MTFEEAQVKALNAKLSAKHVRTRKVGNQILSYVEGWHVIAEANRIFGFAAWDRQTLNSQCVWEGSIDGVRSCSYTARVRVIVRAGDTVVTREGSGFGHGVGHSPGEAHEKALKEAETDAMKRALATFGNPFGLALYDKEKRGVSRRGGRMESPAPNGKRNWVVLSPRMRPVATFSDPLEYCSEVKRRISEFTTIEALNAFWDSNSETLNVLKRDIPHMSDKKGRHYSEILIEVYASKQKDLAPAPAADGAEWHASKLTRANNQQLATGAQRRIRDKDHLKTVCQMACLVCGKEPSQSHHIQFAQSHGLGQKVGDQWVVPLCAAHHRALHDAGNERTWWTEFKVNPLREAESLWQSRRSDASIK